LQRARRRSLLALLLALSCSACFEAAEQVKPCPWQQDAINAEVERFASGDCLNGACLTAPLDVVPSAGLPAEVITQNANNNLDVVSHDCRVFLAFRTGPYHFADELAMLYVVSSEDQVHWRYEGEFAMGTDLREPRLLSNNGRLFLYFAVLGHEIYDFEPQGMMLSEYLGSGQWTEPQWFYGEGFIPWRSKRVDGRPYLLAYVGGENIYDFTEGGVEVHWLTSIDGLQWGAVIPDQPVVLSGGVSETDFVLLSNGDLVAVSRNELGDPELGWGMQVCRAESGALGDWRCIGDPRKYDSPLLFAYRDQPFLIGRRNLTETGHYDLGMRELPFEDQALRYEMDYWGKRKRTALWRVDPRTLEVTFVRDLPSRGDTSFPGLLTVRPGLYEVYNYSNAMNGPDLPWNQGQFEHTLIYRIGLRLE